MGACRKLARCRGIAGLAGSHIDGSNITGSNITGSHIAGSHIAGSHIAGSHISSENRPQAGFVFCLYAHRSMIAQFGHSGLRALHT
jgi:hypothetical protein